MAKLIKVNHIPTSKEVFRTNLGPVTLELTGQEAVTLMQVLRKVGGNPTGSPRRYTASMLEALEQSEHIRKAYKRARDSDDLRVQNTSSIVFLDSY